MNCLKKTSNACVTGCLAWCYMVSLSLCRQTLGQYFDQTMTISFQTISKPALINHEVFIYYNLYYLS
jgi:hypothetical protein